MRYDVIVADQNEDDEKSVGILLACVMLCGPVSCKPSDTDDKNKENEEQSVKKSIDVYIIAGESDVANPDEYARVF